MLVVARIRRLALQTLHLMGRPMVYSSDAPCEQVAGTVAGQCSMRHEILWRALCCAQPEDTAISGYNGACLFI